MTFFSINIKEILHNYERTRNKNKRVLQDRKEEIYKLIPRIEEIDSTSSLSYLEVAKKRVMGLDSDNSFTHSTKDVNRKLTEEKISLLTQAGYPADYLEPIYTCKLCKDTGYIEQEKCKCFMSHVIDGLYLQSNLKNILEKENFDTFVLEYYSKDIPSDKQISPYDNIQKILVRSKEFINCFDDTNVPMQNLLIYGETGMGKTFLTNCIAKALLDNGHSVLYLSANELFEQVLGEYLMHQKMELEDLYKYVYNSELLIIDDLGTELTNNFVLSQLFEIINRRHNSGLSTLISTNLSMKQLRDKYSERIMSRIVANYTVFNIYGDNIRYQKRKQAINSIT